jgi:hypothetical protein
MTCSLPLLLSFLAVALASCSGQDRSISDKIRFQVQASTTAPLDFTLVGPDGWERVCIFGPYTSNELVEADLGFKWNAGSESSISVNDGINLIVFARGKQIVAFAEHGRGHADFESDEHRCTLRTNAKLARSARPDGVPLFTMPR